MIPGDRIKRIREHFCGGSNLKFARAMGKEPNTTSNWMSRGVSDEIAVQILEIFPSISSEWLLRGEGEIEKRPFESEGRFVTNQNIVMVPLIGKYAYAGYISGFGDDEFVDTLPVTPFFPDDNAIPHGEYRGIEVRGDSMDDGTPDAFLDGDLVICRIIKPELYINCKLHYKKWTFVIVTRDGILLKNIVNHDVERCTITVHSLNDYYPNQEIHLADVMQIMNVVQLIRKPKRK